MDASPLGRLSPEIRNTIYEMIILPDFDDDTGDPAELGELPALTRVCSQMREESLPMVLCHAVFRIDLYYDAARHPDYYHAIDIEHFASWLSALPDRHYSILNLAMELHCDFSTQERSWNPLSWDWRANDDPELWSRFEKSLEHLAEVLGRRGCKPYLAGQRYERDYEIQREFLLDNTYDLEAADEFVSKAFRKFGIRLGLSDC